MPVSDWSKLASFDAATFQIFVVADSAVNDSAVNDSAVNDSAVATVNAFVAEAISFAHFVRVFVTRTVHFQISGPPFLPLFLRILAPSSRAQSLPFLSSTLLPLLLIFSFFSPFSPHLFLCLLVSFWSCLTSPWCFSSSPLPSFSSLSVISLPFPSAPLRLHLQFHQLLHHLFNCTHFFISTTTTLSLLLPNFNTPLLGHNIKVVSNRLKNDKHTRCHMGRGNSLS